MVDVKEIKAVKLAPFTLMASSISAILAFIGAILYLILFSIVGAFLPNFGAALALLGVALVIILPIAAFFIGITTNFFSAFLYNSLVPRLGGIKLGLEGSDVTEVPVVSFALILAVIQAIWAFIVGLVLAAALVPFTTFLSSAIPLFSEAIVNATNASGAAAPTGAVVGAAGVFGALVLIIGLPIMVFIVGFIGNALAALFYNFIAIRASKIKLEFVAVKETLFELKTIPPIPAALAIAVVFTIFGLIQGIIDLIRFSAMGDALTGLGSLIGNIIMNFIAYFIITAIAAFLYNFLVPRIGGIKLDLE
ncbi:MAG: hypothetical protein LUQ24_01390 [Methanobacterium sp.]|nr:hypothetical protein [Methanobacterium sp.]